MIITKTTTSQIPATATATSTAISVVDGKLHPSPLSTPCPSLPFNNNPTNTPFLTQSANRPTTTVSSTPAAMPHSNPPKSGSEPAAPSSPTPPHNKHAAPLAITRPPATSITSIQPQTANAPFSSRKVGHRRLRRHSARSGHSMSSRPVMTRARRIMDLEPVRGLAGFLEQRLGFW